MSEPSDDNWRGHAPGAHHWAYFPGKLPDDSKPLKPEGLVTHQALDPCLAEVGKVWREPLLVRGAEALSVLQYEAPLLETGDRSAVPVNRSAPKPKHTTPQRKSFHINALNFFEKMTYPQALERFRRFGEKTPECSA